MSTPTSPPSKGVNTTVLIVAATTVVVVVIAAITLVALAIEDGARATSMIALIVGPLASLLGFFGLFVTVQTIKSDVAKGLAQTTELTNGLGDAKFRGAIADVLPDHMIDPAYAREQLGADRARRAAAAEAAAALVEPHAYPERADL